MQQPDKLYLCGEYDFQPIDPNQYIVFSGEEGNSFTITGEPLIPPTLTGIRILNPEVTKPGIMKIELSYDKADSASATDIAYVTVMYQKEGDNFDNALAGYYSNT